MLGSSVLVLLLALWLGIDLLRARAELSAAREGFTAVQDRLEQGDVEGARVRLAPASAASGRAADLVGGIPFAVFGRVPLISPGVREIQALTDAVDVVGGDALPALLRSDLRIPTWTGRIDAKPFLDAQRPLARAEGQLLAVQSRVELAPRAGIPQITRARAELGEALDRVTRTLAEARVAADVVPVLSGQAGPKRYFIALQNNAESRSTGGLIGAYALLRLDRGALTLERVGQNDQLVDRDRPVVDLGPEYDLRYSRFETTRTWRSANLTPDVPTAGRLLHALWKSRTGEQLDGIGLMDPVALARLLGATGPVTLSDGTSISAANAVQLLESELYLRYPQADQSERNAFLAETAELTFKALSTRRLDGRAVAREFARAVGSGHLQLWAADADVQNRLLRSRVSGALPTAGPYLSVVTNDVGGSKLDYYQHRTVSYAARSTGVAVDLGVGPELEEQANVVVRLENRAPATGLPDYVVARIDDPSRPRGQSHTWVSVYLGPRATLLGATLNGRPVALESSSEKGLSVYSTFVRIDAGGQATLKLQVKQPATPDAPLLYRQQPLVRDDVVRITRQGSPRPTEPFYRSS